MRFVSRTLRSVSSLAGLMFLLLNLQPAASAETRLFVPEFRMGGGLDTQLLITNGSDRDASVDVWAFMKGSLLGQQQLLMRAHATRSLTLSEVFGSSSVESSGWLAAVSNADDIQMSYHVLGDESESRDAEAWPNREAILDIPQGARQVVRLLNTGSVANKVTVRRIDDAGAFAGLQEVTIAPFQQIELSRESLQNATHIEVLATSDVLATVGENASIDKVRLNAETAATTDDGLLSLVIDRSSPLGAYQVLLRFDPHIVQFSQDDILGGSAAGFTSKPVAVNIDNVSGRLRIASFQVGSGPQGSADVAHIRLRSSLPAKLQFGLKVEEITDVQGRSELKSTDSVRLVRLK